MGSGIDISVRADFKGLEKSLDYLARQQIPFAESEALTSIARSVVAAQVAALPSALHKKPTTFTMNAFGVIPSRKSTLQAVVFAKDKQAEYLAPSENGGPQVLGNKRAIIKPVNVKLNQYGNIPRGKIAQQLASSNVFSGSITFKSGQTVSGVWQRGAVGARRNGGRGNKGRNLNVIGGVRTTLTLLERWSDGVSIAPHLGYRVRAEFVVQKSYQPAFDAAMSKALSTAKSE